MIAAAALYVLARGSGAPQGEIGAASRARLEGVLEGAERGGGG